MALIERIKEPILQWRALELFSVPASQRYSEWNNAQFLAVDRLHSISNPSNPSRLGVREVIGQFLENIWAECKAS